MSVEEGGVGGGVLNTREGEGGGMDLCGEMGADERKVCL